MDLLSGSNFFIAFCLSIVHMLGLHVCRAIFDGLSRLPGSKFATASLWYEFCYDDVLKKGQNTWEIRRMQEKYGESVV